MASIGNQFGQVAKKTSQQTAQAIAQQVKRETIETARSVQKQVGMPESGQAPKKETQAIPFLDLIQASPPQDVDKDALKKNEEMLLRQWQQRIKEIEAEMNSAREVRARQTENWQENTQQMMKSGDGDRKEEGVPMPQGKVRKMVGAAASKVKSKMPNLQKTGENRAGRGKQ